MRLMKTMIAHLGKEDEHPVQRPVRPVEKVSVVPDVFFVAIDLESRHLEYEKGGNRDIEYEEKIYHRLDPEYFVWLRFRMAAAGNAHKARKLSDNRWNILRE